MKKRILSFVLVLSLISSLIISFPITASATSSGTCGDNLTWTLDDDGILTISGTGDMYNWDVHNGCYTPWHSSSKKIKAVKIENGVTSIGEQAFYWYFTNLSNVTIPDSVTSIEYGAFYYCTSLKSITIPDSVTNIGSYAFAYRTGLTSITIPKNVTSMGDNVFWDSKLASVTISDGVTNIGKYAFSECYHLTNITIPKSVTSIGSYAFYDCRNLTSIFVDSSNNQYSSENGVLFNKNKTTLICCPSGKVGSYEIPDGVTSISRNAFRYGDLSSVMIPEGVTSIGAYAFYECYRLTNIMIPNSVTSIGDCALGASGLTDVYYDGSEVCWQKISKGRLILVETNATIHFNSERNNDNNYSEISANTQHNLPNTINKNIKINKTGKAYAYFILHDQNGNVYKNKSYSYKIKGNENTVYIGQTDINGIAAVSTGVLTSILSSKTTTKTITVEFTNDDLLQKSFTFDVAIAPPSYKQLWTGKVELGANAGISLGVAGSVGTLKGEAELASVGASGKTAKTISVEDIYKDGVRDLHLTSSIDQSIATQAKLGLYTGIGNSSLNQELSLGKVEGEVSTGYTLGKGFYIENYNPDNPQQRMNIELFLLDTAMGLDGSNVVPHILLNYWLEQNGLPTSNEEKSDVSLLFKAGASLPTIQLGSISTSVGGMNTEALYQFSKSKDHEDKTTTSTKVKVTADRKLFNTSYKGTAGKSDVSIKTGSAVYADRFINNSIQFSATTADSGVEKISFKTAEDSDISSLFTEKTSTEYFKNISYSGNAAKNLVNQNSFMKTIANGNFSFFGISSAQSVADDMTAGTYTADFSREKEYTEEFGQKFSFGLGDNLGIDFGLAGTHKYSYTAETGIIDDGYEYIKTSNTIDEEIKNNGKNINEILGEIMDGIKDDFSDVINEITGSVKDGIEWMKAKIEGAVNWTVKLTSFNTGRVGIQSYSIMSVAEETDTIEDASVATTIGEPYIVDVTDSSGNEIKDFGSNTLDLSLYFDSDDFAVAEVGYTKEMMDKLKIYYWDSEKGVYVCVGGTLDAENSCVTTKISRPGQYILAVDNCPPAITEFVVSSSSATPTISAIVADMSGIATFTFTLDGEEIVTIDNFYEYYNSSVSAFTYKVTEPLSEGEHTASIIASDSSGNAMFAPEEIVFTVDSASPKITSVNVPELSTTQKLSVTATAEDDNLSSLIVSVEYDRNTYSYPMTEIDDVWQVEIDEMPKFARLNVSVSAYDDAGNCTTSEQYEAILATKYTEEVYIGVLDYEDKNVEVLINNTSNEDVEALLIVNGYDENNNLIETKTSEISAVTGYLLKDVSLDNSCYKIRAELVCKDDNTSYICTGFSAYLNETKPVTEKSYIVTLVDGNTTSQMTYDEFNTYIPEPRDGYVFMGWYLNSSFEPSMKIDRLTADYGEEITLYGLWVNNKELVKANVSKSYSDEELTVDIAFDSSYIGGSVTVDILKNADDTTPIKSVSKEFAAYDTELTFNIPFTGDDKEYILRVSFYDNLTDKNELAEAVEATFIAEKPIYSYNGFYYKINDDGSAGITGYRYSYGSLYIPITLNGYKVTKILDSAFESSAFETVLIPDTITEIDAYAFDNCDWLETVNYIGTEEQWNAITIGKRNNALKNADKVFNYSENIVRGGFDEVEFTGSVVEGTLGFDYAYKNCVAIIEITDYYDDEIEKTVEIEISAGTEEKEFSIPFVADDERHNIHVSFVNNTVDKTEFGEEDWEYFYAEKIRYVDGDWTYAIVDENAEVLSYSGENTGIVIPDTLGGYSVTKIGGYAFERSNLTAISIPKTVTHIGEYAFCDTEIAEITLPDNLTYIGESAFAGTEITEISIPASVASIGDFAFDYCYNLAKITVDENNENYCSDDGNLYSKDKTELVRYALGKTVTSWTIPNTVTTVKSGALTDSEYLTNVTIPNSVTKIEENAFAYALWETLTIPESVTQIDNAAFVYCENLTEIKVDSGNKNYCDDNGVLLNKDKTILLQYPTGKTNTFYKLPDTVKTISQESFARCSLQTIALPTSLEVVEMAAFNECNSLDTVFYAGTKDEYWEIDFTYHNNVLSNANITFGYDGMPASIKSVYCWYDNNKVTAKIKFNYLEQAGALYLAVYDEGRLVALKIKPVAIDELEHTIKITDVDETYKDYDVKVFYWDGTSSLMPLAKFIETEVVEYDSYDYQVGIYSGIELAGQTITVPGNTVKIRLTSDGSNTEYGYKTESIVINK